VPTLGGAPEIIVSPVFDEKGFDSGEESSLRIPDAAQHVLVWIKLTPKLTLWSQTRFSLVFSWN
jgi:hypothetical protein